MAKLGWRTTADEALQGLRLDGRTVVVTGASSGIGVETVRALAYAGANVTLACRNVALGEEVRKKLESTQPSGAGALQVAELDLSKPDSVRAFAAAFSTQRLDLLVNNAGIMATPLGFTALGIEQQMATNHLGHFLLTQLLRPRLEASRAARVVTVASSAHRRGSGASILATLESDRDFKTRSYRPFTAYGDSKLANILFTRALAKRLPPQVLAFSLHPGVIVTHLTRVLGKTIDGLYHLVGVPFTKTAAQGAATSVWAATAPELAPQSGAFLKNCALATAKPAGRDDALAERLWELSAQLVGA